MKIIADECLAQSTIKVLKEFGFEVLEIDQILHSGALDEEIYEYATKHGIPMITHDRRFGQIYFDSSNIVTTTLILEVMSPQPKGSNILLRNFLKNHDIGSPNLASKLILIFQNKIRIREK